jgi:tRNA(Ile)-lysidine synthase
MKQIDPCLIKESIRALCPISLLEPTVARYLEKNQPNHSAPWCVACSGGADSVFLLLVLATHYAPSADSLAVLHYNHNERGIEAEGDVAYVEQLTKTFGYAFYSEKAPDKSKQTHTTEAQLRLLRHTFFKSTLDRLGSSVLLLGHQRDDVEETVLMRLLRGSGSAGLSAPRPIQLHNNRFIYLRPLLNLSKTFIENCLQELGVDWREDASNQSNHYFRNQIRNHILPILKKSSLPFPTSNLALSRKLLEEEDHALTIWLSEQYPEGIQKTETLDALRLIDKPRALLRRALNQWLNLHELLPSLDRKAVDEYIEAFETPAKKKQFRFSVSQGFIILDYPIFLYQKIEYEKPFPYTLNATLNTTVYLPNGYKLIFKKQFLNAQLKQSIFKGAYTPDSIVFLNEAKLVHPLHLHIRSWQAGDAYKPLNAPGTRKLQDLFIDRKIPIADRHALPMICDHAGSILWCPGIPVANTYKIEAQTQIAWVIIYQPSNTAGNFNIDNFSIQ